MKGKRGNRIKSILLCVMLVLRSLGTNIDAAAISGSNAEQENISETISGNELQEITPSENERQEKTVSENDAQEKTEDTISENDLQEKMEDTVSGNNTQEKRQETVSANDWQGTVLDGQYHFIEEDSKTVKKWLELYCPNGFEELLTYDETWWNSLYDYERDYAEFLLELIVERSENVYEEQELSECIAILESGVEADDFFRGTVYQGLTLEDLKELEKTGMALEDLLVAENAVEENAPSAYALQSGDLVAKVSVAPTGYSGTGHGTIYKITLGGRPAICISYGKACRSSFLYRANPGSYQKKMGRLGYFASYANVSGATYAACQIAAWLFLKDENMSEASVRSRAQAMLNVSSEETLEKMLTYVTSFYISAKSYTGAYCEYYSDNANAQTLIVLLEANPVPYTPPGRPITPEEPSLPGGSTLTKKVKVDYTIEVHKKDWQSGVGLSGCEVELLEDGENIATLITDGNGYASYTATKEAEFSASYDNVSVTRAAAESAIATQEAAFRAISYTYSTEETTAPYGYVWAENAKSKTIAGGQTAVFQLTNERTLGAVELIKYDTESECGEKQGNAALDGAVYGIYAAEDIRHQDRKTGVIYRKDELVQTAVIGKTPKRNDDGYLLNTNGSRHIANAGGEIAYEDTPGKTLFGDLELGSYYIKEIEPSEGYMLDETIYPATFTYHWQMVKIESRKETAQQADNELTVDDESKSKSIYSGDYAIKQGVGFVKTSDNAYQTELKPIEGAGFSVYLISALSGVQDGSITPIGDDWTADDVMTFYDYDFTEEKTATLYKRTEHEQWTEGDTLWLAAGEKPNEYYVKEMFTDEDGRIVTPELPYGTYVIAETSTPEHHASAKPFIVYITKDGGVLYTDAARRKVEKIYEKEDSVRYGDRALTKDREGRMPQKQRIINNTITKAYLRILKADREFTILPGAYVEAEEFVRGTVLKEGAAYRLKCVTLPLSRESLFALNWKFDEEGYMRYYDPGAKTVSGTPERPFQTNFLRKNGAVKDCFITLPQEIPIGTYELEELTAPKGYVVNGSEQTILDSSTDRINRYTITDAPSPRVVFTINNGAVYPDGQMGLNKYALIDSYGNLTVTLLQENQEQKGVLEITKHGKQLSGIHQDTETLLDKLKGEPFREIKKAAESSHQDLAFEYEDAPVEGASFQVIAAEDIYTQELQKELLDKYDVKKEDYLRYKKGEVAATITTDRNGFGYAANLYIGKYKIVETKAGDGFVLNKKETEFEITAQEQNINFDFHTADYQNERQKLEIVIEKQAQEDKTPLAGAVYGLYAQEDIMTNLVFQEAFGKWKLRDTPTLLYPADKLIATCITDSGGKGVFDEDLPLGKYIVRELEGPRGYLTALSPILIDGSYESIKGGQNVEKQEHHRLFQNKKTQAFITKRDLVSDKEIEGATLEIKEIEVDEDGNPKRDAAGNDRALSVISWISKAEEKTGDRKGHLIEGLQLGRAYLLSEQTAPDGYGYAEDILFKLEQEKRDGALTDTVGLYVPDGDAWNRAAQDLLVMYDEKKALDIEKSTIKTTQRKDIYQYTVDELKNLTKESLEHFTMTDHLPEAIYLTECWTGTYNEELLYDVEYRTNLRKDWIAWEGGLSTAENHHLQVPEELQAGREYVTDFRMLFGTVGSDFAKVKSPKYMTYVSPDAKGVILTEIELTAEQNGKKLRDKDTTETGLYQKTLSGYRANGGKEPLYEIVEAEQEITEPEISVIRQIAWKRKTETEEEENIENGMKETEEKQHQPEGNPQIETSVRTGDDTPLVVFGELVVLSLTGLIILWLFGRKRKK